MKNVRNEVITMGITRGHFTRNFYILPTIIINNGDGIYTTLEFAWLKWYIGFIWHHDNEKSE